MFKFTLFTAAAVAIKIKDYVETQGESDGYQCENVTAHWNHQINDGDHPFDFELCINGDTGLIIGGGRDDGFGSSWTL
jgi:hypothetical protein